MRLPTFAYERPDSLEKALDLLSEHKDRARVLAGGTDLLVRMKKQLVTPGVLVSLKDVPGLSYVRKTGQTIQIGAATPLAGIMESDVPSSDAPALSQACAAVGAATIQHYAGTIGGNILQDTRCIHYNQSAFHRSGRQPCHKDGGKICYAREEADRCYSTCQSDTATALMALDASLVLSRTDGERTVRMADFYTSDGMSPFAMEPGELLTRIDVPAAPVSAYERLAWRSAIDYPIVSAAAAVFTSGRQVQAARISVGSMGRAPLYLAQASASLEGTDPADNTAWEKAARMAKDSAEAFAVHNVGATLDYRCAMVETMVYRALAKALGQS